MGVRAAAGARFTVSTSGDDQATAKKAGLLSWKGAAKAVVGMAANIQHFGAVSGGEIDETEHGNYTMTSTTSMVRTMNSTGSIDGQMGVD